MTVRKHSAGESALAAQVRNWVEAETADQELKRRITVAIDEIKDFVARHLAGLEKRKGRLIQTTGFRDETRAMQASLEKVHHLLAGGKNVSRIFEAIDGFLETYKADEFFDKDHVRTQLIEAGESFLEGFRGSIRGTRLSDLLGILCFMPYSLWRFRGIERRNFRSPSATEVAKLLEQFRRCGVDVDAIDAVRLAAMVRILLGITPRMDYQRMPGNKLAEKLVDEEVITMAAAAGSPVGEAFCRAVAGIQSNVRRWSAECFGSGLEPLPPEIEAEMLQLVYLAGDTIRIGGDEKERSSDFLWLLATVIAGNRDVLKGLLSRFADEQIQRPSVRGRFEGAQAYLEAAAAVADGMLFARWSEAKAELGALTVRSEAIASKSAHEFAEHAELEALKDKRADVVKSLIKAADSIQMIESAVLEGLTARGTPAGHPAIGGPERARGPAEIRDRNYRISEETKTIAALELERLRLLIQRIVQISRRGFAGSGPRPSQGRQAGDGRRTWKTSDGVEIATLSSDELHAKLCGTLRKNALFLQEVRGKVEGVRRRLLKGDLQHAVNVLCDRTRKAGETCAGADLAAGDAARALEVSEGILVALRDTLTALINLAARVGSAKLTPAEKQPLTTMLYGMKQRLGDDLRDGERLRTVLAGRLAGAEAETLAAAASGSAQKATGDTAGISAVATIADLVAQAVGSLKSVETTMAGLKAAFGSAPRDGRRISDAASALRGETITALDVVTANRMQIVSLAAKFTVPAEEHVEKFDRWKGLLVAIEGETVHLLAAMAAVAEIRQAVATAAAFEHDIAKALRPPPGNRAAGEPFVPVRQRCADALAACDAFFEQVRRGQSILAAARAAAWKQLKPASLYVGSLSSDLSSSEAALRDTHARIAAIHDRFKADRPGPR